jgi:predicted dehydrogenase
MVGMKKRLGVALLGTGFVGRVHLEAIRRLGYVDVRGLSVSNPERATKAAAEFGIERVVADYRALLDDPSVDAVDICTPNALHLPMASDALTCGKHVICEKPLATSADDASKLVSLAREKNRRNCTCYNLRYYPLVQQMRRMREDGDLGEILVVQGTYSQDWLLYDTDWNWRIESRANGPSRAMADIGSHWCDMAEHVTGQRITALCADVQTFHKIRKRPKKSIETFAGKVLKPESYIDAPIDTEDFGAVIFRMGERTRGSFTASQVSAGRKNRLSLEIYGTKGSVVWDGERPNELWIGSRNMPNQIIVKDPSLLKEQARPFADLPGGHAEGYADTFKQVFERFYGSIENPGSEPEYPQFNDGLRQLTLVEAGLASSAAHAWVGVPS